MTLTPTGNRVVLYLSGASLSAWVFRNTRPIGCESFGRDDASTPAFQDFLRRQHGARFFLLCDLPDERFVTDSMPYTWGPDRSALLTLKLQKHCANTPFRSARAVRRLADGRRDLQIQLHALDNAGALQPWLEVLDRTGVALCGVHTIAQAAGRLLRRLRHHQGQALLIAATLSGLRQIFTDQGLPRFCRLSSLPPDGDFAAAGAGAARSVRDYLIAQRMLGRDRPLQLWILAPESGHAALAAACADDAGLRCGLIDAGAQLRADGVRFNAGPLANELLLARAVVMRPPRTQLAPAAHLQVCRIRHAAGLALYAGLCALAAGTAFAGHAIWSAHVLDAQRQRVLLDTSALRQREQALSARLPELGYPLDTLRRVVERHEQLRQRSATPADLLQTLGAVLAQLPDIQPASLEWSLTSLPSPVPGTLPPVRAELLLTASLPVSHAAQPRRAQDVVDAARALLTQDPGIEVDIVRAPFDVDARTRNTAEARAPEFTLRIRRMLPCP
ncbi:hypothetical protein [Methyloversatilis thermotolerans]|uniref:hypothetical protein n=1 Tax=Methyloversatilis thermotolerans TaxID=1346290 RepID=UPI000369BC2D|nr:hypothetical protein [Methyloversatilis thermotolerans]